MSRRTGNIAAAVGCGLWAFWVLVFFGFWGTVAYVVFHFLGKAW